MSKLPLHLALYSLQLTNKRLNSLPLFPSSPLPISPLLIPIFKTSVNSPLTYLKHRGNENWLIGYDTHQFNQLTQELFEKFIDLSQKETPPKILLAEQNEWRFLATFLAAVSANCPIFLGNPNWVQNEWQQVVDLIQPDLSFGKIPTTNNQQSTNNQPTTNNQQPTTNNQQQIMIPTGGSSGKIRFAVHSWQTLIASVEGFHQYFNNQPINSFCVLPLYHVSGLMQFLRSLTTGGKFIIFPFKDLVAGEGQPINISDFFISLVPTQLQRLLTSNHGNWLSQFQTVLLGGATAWDSLLTEARRYNIRLSLTYGMTETASQIVTLKSQDFLAGNNSCGKVLPHANVSIRDTNDKILTANQTGIITIQANSLHLGYYPLEQTPNPKSKIKNLKSDDLGFFDEQGYLHIIGRSSNKIITGGENVFPAEVEAAILATQLVTDVSVIGLPDEYWGQVVTAIYVPNSPDVSPHLLQNLLMDQLSKFKYPKYWIQVKTLPRNTQGKVNYQELKKIALASLSNTKSGLKIPFYKQ
ncbi:MAG TPA: 2-succinylbenzoate-CoA ligase [Cyanobacteria bacterium UBA11370]|nr:2-succinylbenzoate-CoA ligase [Cyanobacteria bacterium UBA11370]HBY81633.1 2-succinylbenzoate-CoA ligase [Cyanobacteria bacterium UBA11148]